MAVAPHPEQSERPHRPGLSEVREALDVLGRAQPGQLWALSESELGELMSALGELDSAKDAWVVGVMAEARSRGLGVGDGWGPVDWARAHAPLMPTRTLVAADVVAGAADELRLARVVAAATEGAVIGSAEQGGEGALPLEKAAQIVRFHKSIRGLADPDVLEEATAHLLHGARGGDGMTEKEVGAAVRHAADMMRPDRLVEHDAELRRAHRSLIKSKGPCGLSRYTWLLDEEGAAVVDAAVDALAKPKPDEETGEHDPRPAHTRRADALLDIVARGVSAPEGTPRQAKTTLMVTISLEALEGRAAGAGVTPTGEVLTPETVRRLSCDAQLVPMVLGSRGEVLDQGQAIRLFNRAQIRHLWLRDKHCTFPGCRKPPGWTDAHHLVHWAHGGKSNISNAALLCRAHHSVVHSHRYAGRVVDGPNGPRVEWDLTVGSYDVLLRQRRALALVPRSPVPDGPDRP